MATISTRINSSGTFLVNGSFDEITYNRTSPVIKNLLIYTDSFDNVNWGKGSVSITANSTIAPDGTIVADTIVENTTPSSYHFINQSFNKTATANTYTYSIYAKDAGRSGLGLRIDNNAGSGAVVTYNVATGATILGAGTYGSFTSASSNILSVGNGWYRISLTATTDASTTVAFVQNYLHSIPAGTTVYTGDGISGIYIWGAQLEQNSTATIYQGIVAANTLVTPTFKNKVTSNAVYVTDIFDEVTFNPLTSGLYIGNSLSYSQDLTQTSVWSYSSGGSGVPPVVTPNVALAPDGTLTADRVVFDTGPVTGTGQSSLNQGNAVPLTTGTSQTFSVWMRAETTATSINMYNGDSINGPFSVDTNWTRYSLPITYTSPVAYGVRIAKREIWGSGGTGTVLIWGAQLNSGLTATIYVPTGATATPISTSVKKETSNGSLYVTGKFDEVTGAPIIDSSVVLWLDPAQTTSYPGTGTTWIDLSTSNNTGTLTSASTFDRVDGAGSFNFAITNYATLATNLVPSGSRTIVIAFKTTDIINRAGVISARDGAGGWFVCLNRAGGGNFTYSLNNVPANNDLQATNAITQTNTWYIAVITHDDVSDVGKIYLNGNLIVSATMGEILPISSLNSYVGREVNSANNFPGWIGSVIVYNRALDADEVQQNFNALRRRYGI